MKLRLNTLVILLSVLFSVLLVSACSSLESLDTPVQIIKFDDYQSETIQHLRESRNFQLTDNEAELQWNAPQQWMPDIVGDNGKAERGILFVHGLGDSPWSFYELGEKLAEQGFLVRTVLLPGHGTNPHEMLDVKAEEWQKVVYEQAQTLSNDVNGDVFLGGFSTGANIVLDYAYEHPDIAGLIFFSPGFKSMPFDWLAPLVSKVRPWIMAPESNIPMQTPLRYMNVPTNGYAQYYRTSAKARKLLEHKYEKPVFMAVAEHDSILDTNYLLEVFQTRFTHPQSRLIWYGAKVDDMEDTNRVFIRNDKLPEEHISQFSHMGLLFSPENELYGREGTQRICLNGMNGEERKACENGAELWFAGWGYSEEGKVHARLTFNPYFDWQITVILDVLNP
ncbi:alpha/beta hydrolase [Alteromonas macleodii]|uniref:alpha/beta hydrolase n=1 Tax=Alteromonas macleodii TaxID=28108 RepID=UPI0036469C47